MFTLTSRIIWPVARPTCYTHTRTTTTTLVHVLRVNNIVVHLEPSIVWVCVCVCVRVQVSNIRYYKGQSISCVAAAPQNLCVIPYMDLHNCQLSKHVTSKHNQYFTHTSRVFWIYDCNTRSRVVGQSNCSEFCPCIPNFAMKCPLGYMITTWLLRVLVIRKLPMWSTVMPWGRINCPLLFSMHAMQF